MNYRFTDPGRFDKKFQTINGIDPELYEVPLPDNLNTEEDPPQKSSNNFDQNGKKRSQEISQTPDRRSTKTADIIGKRVRFKDEADPVGVPVALYSSNSMKNHQRRIYQIGTSDHYEIGKTKEWSVSELENLPEVSGSKETILDIPMKSSPVQYQYNFSNIEEVVALVAPYSEKASHETQPRVLLTRPTYVLIKWKDILPEHLNHPSLMEDCKSFILKSKLLGAISKTSGITLRGWIDELRGQNESG
jgi:hypothetical protein